MSRQAKILIFGVILFYSIYNYQIKGSDLILNYVEKVKTTSTSNKNIEKPKASSNTRGNVKSIGNYIYKTKLISNRLITYELYDEKNLKEEILRISKKDDPIVYVINSQKNFSTVVLEYNKNGVKFLYRGRIANYVIEDKSDPINTKIDFLNNKNKPKANKVTNNEDKWDYDSDDYLSVPESGHSPYDNYFGEGIYAETENYLEITAPSQTHVVFVVIDVYSKRRIRNEFIRKGEKFKMTKIPYGTYDYMYFTGRNWDKNILLNNGKIKGGFRDYQSFQKNQFMKDRLEYERGFYGGYTIKLTQSIGGNLETQSTSENNFFN